MNRSHKTATGRTNLGNAGNHRPDITDVRRDGKVDLYEVQSASDPLPDVAAKLNPMRMAPRADNRGDRFLIDINDDRIALPLGP